MNPEMIDDTVESNSAYVGPDRLPKIPVPEIDANANEWVAERQAGEERSAEAYRLYVENHSANLRLRGAVSRLKGPLSPEDRRKDEQEAAQAEEHRLAAGHFLTVHKELERRLRQISPEDSQAGIAWAEQAVAEARDAAEALAPMLADYLDKFATASARWRNLESVTRGLIEKRDARFGHYRTVEAVRELAVMNDCPIDSDSAQTVLTVMPRPTVFE